MLSTPLDAIVDNVLFRGLASAGVGLHAILATSKDDSTHRYDLRTGVGKQNRSLPFGLRAFGGTWPRLRSPPVSVKLARATLNRARDPHASFLDEVWVVLA